jgi:tRNA(Ile)-lysidine synthase TilS/MesJ
MKLESIKILVGEIDYKLGRIEFFKERLEKWENKEEREYEQSQRRLAKLIDETTNLLQIMKLEELDNFKEYEEIVKKLDEHT